MWHFAAFRILYVLDQTFVFLVIQLCIVRMCSDVGGSLYDLIWKFEIVHLLYFQLSYPRSGPIRKGWVLRQAGKLVVFLGLMGFIIEQVQILWLLLSLFCILESESEYASFCSNAHLRK